jgi:hypothetical protein
MFCRSCGAPNDDRATNCSKCGAPLGSMAPPAIPAESIPNYLVQAILTTVFCCLPFGIVSIVYAAQVNSKQAAGDLAGALDCSRKAKMWMLISFGIGLAFSLLYFGMMILGIVAGAANGPGGAHNFN